MKRIENKIFSTLNKNNMLGPLDTVVVAVSGGADSMCLLHFFNKFSSMLNINIICAHVNHGIRGAEALRDEKFVSDFCKEHNIHYESACYDVPAIAAEYRESPEECGRRLRYAFFNSLGENIKIATAHNLNDSAETFIFNLARGAGLKGLLGIPAVRDNIIRPLSECTRNEIEDYLLEENISFVTDSTNLSDEYARNKVRHSVIPVLTELNSGFFVVFQQCMDNLSSAEKYLADISAKAFEDAKRNDKFLISELKKVDKYIARRVIKLIAEYFGGKNIESRHVFLIESLLDSVGAVNLPGNIKIVSDGKFLFMEEEKKAEIVINERFELSVKNYQFPRCTINVDSIDNDILKKYNVKELSKNGYADAEKFVSAVFRTRLPGDRFRFPFAPHSKSLKNLFKERNISSDDRWGIPMIADDEDILWICGAGVSDKAKITEKTKSIIKLDVMIKKD